MAPDDICNKGGGALILLYYKGSLIRAVQTIYPEHDWHVWKFLNTKMPKGWQDDRTSDLVLSDLAKRVGITNHDDWYRVSKNDIRRCRAMDLVTARGGLMKILSEVYPNHGWIQRRFTNHPRKWSQWQLFKIIKQLLPYVEVIENYVHPFLQFSESGRRMELDIYVPTLKLAVEYQGLHHYQGIFFVSPDLQKRDQEKRRACQLQGITLIEIPYWWRHEKASIKDTLNVYRPDIDTS